MGNISIGKNEVDLSRVERNSGKDKGLFEKKVSCFALEVVRLRWEGGLLSWGLWDWMSA